MPETVHLTRCEMYPLHFRRFRRFQRVTGGSGVGHCASAAANIAPEGGVQSTLPFIRRICNVRRNSSDIPSQSVRVPHIVCRASELGSGNVQHPLPLGVGT